MFNANPDQHGNSNPDRHQNDADPQHYWHRPHGYLFCHKSKLCNLHYLTVKWLAASSLVTKDRSCSVIRTAHLPDQ
jgi:hypothetical protein